MTLDEARDHGRAITAAVEQFVASAIIEMDENRRGEALRVARENMTFRIADMLLATRTK